MADDLGKHILHPDWKLIHPSPSVVSQSTHFDAGWVMIYQYLKPGGIGQYAWCYYDAFNGEIADSRNVAYTGGDPPFPIVTSLHGGGVTGTAGLMTYYNGRVSLNDMGFVTVAMYPFVEPPDPAQFLADFGDPGSVSVTISQSVPFRAGPTGFAALVNFRLTDGFGNETSKFVAGFGTFGQDFGLVPTTPWHLLFYYVEVGARKTIARLPGFVTISFAIQLADYYVFRTGTTLGSISLSNLVCTTREGRSWVYIAERHDIDDHFYALDTVGDLGFPDAFAIIEINAVDLTTIREIHVPFDGYASTGGNLAHTRIVATGSDWVVLGIHVSLTSNPRGMYDSFLVVNMVDGRYTEVLSRDQFLGPSGDFNVDDSLLFPQVVEGFIFGNLCYFTGPCQQVLDLSRLTFPGHGTAEDDPAAWVSQHRLHVPTDQYITGEAPDNFVKPVAAVKDRYFASTGGAATKKTLLKQRTYR